MNASWLVLTMGIHLLQLLEAQLGFVEVLYRLAVRLVVRREVEQGVV